MARRASRAGRPGAILLALALLALFALALAMTFAERVFLADVIQHARAHLAGFAALCLGGALLLRRRRLALCALAVALLLGWPVADSLLPQGWPGPAPDPTARPFASDRPERRLTLVAANVLVRNAEPEAMVERLLDTGADVLVLIELDAGWSSVAERLHARYRYSWREGDVTVWSRFPATPPRAGLPAVRGREFTVDVTLDLGGRSLRLLAVHAPRAADRALMRERNWLFAELAAWTRETDLPTVIAGDLNATPWTPALHRLIADPAIRRVLPAGGWYASWPSRLGPLGVPIDHLLLGGPVSATRLAVLEVPGSDHRAVAADLLLPEVFQSGRGSARVAPDRAPPAPDATPE